MTLAVACGNANNTPAEEEVVAEEAAVEVVEASALGPDTTEKQIELIIAKNRQGALRDLPYVFTPAICHFQESKYITKTEDN